MYLRTTRRQNRDGSSVEYHQLAHNVWDPESRRSVVEIIHNFGRADAQDRDALLRLCRSIARVCDAEVVDLASGGDETRPGGVLPTGVQQVVTRPLGVPWVVEALWERLGLDRLLRSLAVEDGVKPTYERALLAMVANRLSVEPSSKLGVWERWVETVHLPDCWGLARDDMYEAMDLLHAHRERVEEAVFFETANLYNLEVDLIFFDTTTASFSVDEEDEEDEGGPGLRRRGRAKTGDWAVQVVVALAVTREGLPVRSWVFPGNTADVSVVQRVREDLRGWKLGRALFIADAGVNSAEKREDLARGCGRYVLACRAASVSEIGHEVLSRPGRYKRVADNLHAKEVVVGEGEMRRRYIVCYNPAEAARQTAHREQVVRELEAELARHPVPDVQAQWAAELRASGRYGRYVAVDKRGRIRLDHEAVREAARYDGKWVLITNDDSLAVDDAADAYKSLLVIERCFRSLKSVQIQMSPMNHWLPRRIETHVKICVLALLFERIAERESGRSWARVRLALDRLQATEYHTDSHRFFQANELPREAAAILSALKIKPPKQVLSTEPLLAPAPGV